MADIVEVKCAICGVPLQGPADPKPADLFSCPQCGTSDSFENVQLEVGEYVTEKAGDYLGAKMRDVARQSKFIRFTEGDRPHKKYRFVVDLNFHN